MDDDPVTVTIRNVGDDTVTVGDVTIDAGKDAEVEADLAFGQLGNPNAVGDAAELTRVQTIWGFYGGFAPDNTWVDVAPKLEVYDADGNRVWLLHDDPTGENREADETKPTKADKADKADKKK